MSKTQKNTQNFKLALLFIGVILFFAFISIFIKVIFLINRSNYDDVNKFNVEILDKNGIGILSFSPKEKTISILKITDQKDAKNIAKFLDIPIDGFINIGSETFKYSNISSSLFHSIFSFNRRENLTSLDLLRLSLFAKKIPKSTIYERKFSNDYSESQKSTILTLTFSDPIIFTENKSVEIINSTEVFGLGSRLANLITNISGNVILVKSSEKQKKSKLIFFGKKSYIVEKLGKYLNLPIEQSLSPGVSDVIIIIGTDSLKNLKF